MNYKQIKELEDKATALLHMAGYAANGQPLKEVLKKAREEKKYKEATKNRPATIVEMLKATRCEY